MGVVTCHLHCCTVLIQFQGSSTHIPRQTAGLWSLESRCLSAGALVSWQPVPRGCLSQQPSQELRSTCVRLVGITQQFCGAPIADTGDGAEACSASAEAQFAFEEVLVLQVCEDEKLISKHPLALIQRLSRISHMLERTLSMRETYCVRTSLSSE